MRLVETGNFQTLEALLTGESVPIDKNTATIHKSNVPIGDRKNTAFMASSVVRGRAKGIVIAYVHVLCVCVRVRVVSCVCVWCVWVCAR